MKCCPWALAVYLTLGKAREVVGRHEDFLRLQSVANLHGGGGGRGGRRLAGYNPPKFRATHTKYTTNQARSQTYRKGGDKDRVL